jgi:diadenylate cyclase
MPELLDTFRQLLQNLQWLDVLDVIIVAYMIAIILLIFLVSFWLPTLHYILKNLLIIPVVLIALVVIFQPELRLALEHLGRGHFLGLDLTPLEADEVPGVIAEVVEAATRLAEKGHGALIVMERTQRLLDIIRTGKAINGRVSVELIMTIFNPRTPLHDGAVVLRGAELLAASCVLPHSERPGLSTETGMRHRAALGLAERTDAAIVVVSEETGNVSLAVNGTLSPALQRPQLTERLMEIFEAQIQEKRFFFWRK